MSSERNNLINKILRSIPIVKRVTMWYTVFIVIISIALTITASFFIDNFVRKDSEKDLHEAVSRMVEDKKEFKSFEDGIFFSMYKRDGKFVKGEIPKGFDSFSHLKDGQFSKLEKDENEYIFFDKLSSISDSDSSEDRYWIRGIIPLDRLNREMMNISWILLLGSPLFITIVLYGGYNITKNAFKPVRKIINTACEIKENKDFKKRINIGYGKDEIYSIANTFNEMLDSLEDSYAKEKEFNSNVSHELRTPLAVILSESQYALSHGDTMDELKESIVVINRQSQKMKELVEQILELSKIEDMTKIESEVVDLTRILLRDIEDYGVYCNERNIKLTYHIEEDIFVQCNKMMIGRVLDNLITNATKFTRSEIEITLKKSGDFAILSIADNGIGISEDNIEKIWNKFYQVDEARNKDGNGGSGLGLSLVKKIIKLHDGIIDVTSELDVGSRFTVSLPLKQK